VEKELVFDLSAADPERFGSFSELVCCDNLRERIASAMQRAQTNPGLRYADLDIPPDPEKAHLLAPITRQEVWAAGVTYRRSREARMEESEGGGSFYDKVYRADRPELFFKGTPHRVAGPNAAVRIRADSKWNVPEPELALVINARGALVGYTIGNDMSSRDIEGENPLYLPQAKVYRGSCALGPALILAESVAEPRDLEIRLAVLRDRKPCFEGATGIGQMKRTFEDLISYLCREQDFPQGVILLTGTGVVPPDSFTLRHGDLIEITVPEIGVLRNTVE
jgi:2-dehydro-3-deoxy-D-arabinonate dehydratase